MLPDFPKSKVLISVFINDFLEKSITYHLGPPFSNIPRRRLNEGFGFITKYNDSISHEGDLKKMGGSFNMDRKTGIENPLLILKELWEVGKKMAGDQFKMTVETISEVTEKVGNSFKFEKDFTPEMFFQAFTKIDIDFNEDGTPRMPQIVAGEEMFKKISGVLLQISNDANYKQKFEDIMTQHKSRWNDRKNNRKLVG